MPERSPIYWSRIVMTARCLKLDIFLDYKKIVKNMHRKKVVEKMRIKRSNKTKTLLFLAHLSRRLTGELIGYPWIRRLSSVHSHFQTSSPLKPWAIKAKFDVEPPWEGGTKVCINGPGHMTKMAAMPIYGKNLKKSSSL